MKSAVRILAAVAVLPLACPALASGAVGGWGIMFQYDVFSDRTFAVALTGETSEGIAFDQAHLSLACAKRKVRVLFQPGSFSFETSIQGKFRGPDGVVSANFSPVEIEGLGRQRAADIESSAALVNLISAATSPVPFQVGDKKGTFPIIGFKEALAIMNDRCNSVGG